MKEKEISELEFKFWVLRDEIILYLEKRGGDANSRVKQIIKERLYLSVDGILPVKILMNSFSLKNPSVQEILEVYSQITGHVPIIKSNYDECKNITKKYVDRKKNNFSKN